MKRKRTAIKLREISALRCYIYLGCLVLIWHSITFRPGYNDGEPTALLIFSDWLIFGCVSVSISVHLGAILGFIFGLVMDILNRWIVPNPPNMKLKYHLILLLWAFIYNLLLTVPLLDFAITDGWAWPIEPFVLGFCFWGVISQILASEYLKNEKSVEASEQGDNMKAD